MRVVFSARFLKQAAQAPSSLVEELQQAADLFADTRNHVSLKVHKLKGPLKGSYAFSVNYKIRVLFYYPRKDVAMFVMFGTHDEVYR